MERHQHNFLQDYRKRTGLSQKHVAYILNLSGVAPISRHERGAQLPELRQLYRYAFIYELPSDDIFQHDKRQEEFEAQKRCYLLAKELEKQPSTPKTTQVINRLTRLYSKDSKLEVVVKKTTGRILSIVPTAIGFGYAIFDDIRKPRSWGVKRVMGNKNIQTLKMVSRLIEWYEPETVVLEDGCGQGSFRRERVLKLLKQIEKFCQTKHIKVVQYSRQQVRDCFKQYGARTKDQIARTIAKQLPEMQHRLPTARQPWEPENYWMAAFDAVALAYTNYGVQ